MSDCSADLGHPCDSGLDGSPCAHCLSQEEYWRREWEAYGRREVANRLGANEIRSCYSEPSERVKQDSLLAQIEG